MSSPLLQACTEHTFEEGKLGIIFSSQSDKCVVESIERDDLPTKLLKTVVVEVAGEEVVSFEDSVLKIQAAERPVTIKFRASVNYGN